jgi:hypothetical protein
MAESADSRIERARRIIGEAFGGQEVGAIWVSDDGKRIMGSVYIDGMACRVTYELDEKTGQYIMRGYNPLGQMKF